MNFLKNLLCVSLITFGSVAIADQSISLINKKSSAPVEELHGKKEQKKTPVVLAQEVKNLSEKKNLKKPGEDTISISDECAQMFENLTRSNLDSGNTKKLEKIAKLYTLFMNGKNPEEIKKKLLAL